MLAVMAVSIIFGVGRKDGMQALTQKGAGKGRRYIMKRKRLTELFPFLLPLTAEAEKISVLPENEI